METSAQGRAANRRAPAAQRFPLQLWIVRMVAVLVVSGAVLVGVNLFSVPSSGRLAGGDFVGFYAPARIIYTTPARLYDLALQQDIQHEITGVRARLPFVHAPFLALLLVPIGMLPFKAAYFTWMLCSALLYGASIAMLAPRRFRQWAIAFAFACPIFPFYVMAAGQVTAIDCFAIAAGIRLESKGHPYLCGLVLSLAAHKPIVPLFIALMFIATRRLRPLASLLAGSLALAGLSLAVIGKEAFLTLIGLNLSWGRSAIEGSFQLAKYIDLNSFGHLLRLQQPVRIALCLLLAAGVAAALVYGWRRATPGTAWALTLTAAVLLSPYTPIYEGSFLVLAVALLSRAGHAGFLPAFIVAACPMALLTQTWVDLVGVQLLTLVGVGVAAACVVITVRARRAGQPPHDRLALDPHHRIFN